MPATRNVILGGGLVLLAALCASVAPLLTYSLSLAAFGLPHVLSELRYVDYRFHARFSVGWTKALWILLALLVLIRATALGGYLSSSLSTDLQLGVLALLILLTYPALVRGGWKPLSIGTLLLGALLIGILRAPLETLVALAFLHNLTPVGFLAERLRGRSRQIALLASLVGFFVVPGFLMTGIPYRALATQGWVSPDASLFAIGPLNTHLGAFIPAPLLERPGTVHLFTAAVYLQCLHYAVVIHVLPKLIEASPQNSATVSDSRPWFHWPSERVFRTLLGILGAVFLLGFAVSFSDTRGLYGVFASVHAWIEVPILLSAIALPEPKPAR